MPEVDAGPALRAAARLGPYFAWQPLDAEPGWRPFGELLDPAVVAERVEAGRRVLLRMSGLRRDEIGERVVASTIFLGLASRLVSPVLAAAALTGLVPLADPGRLWWRPVESGPMPIAYDGLGAAAGSGHDRTAIDQLVRPMLEVFRHRFVLSPQVLWGNVASALGGAVGMIAGNAPGRAAERAATIVTGLLAEPPLAGMATLHRPDPHRARWFLVRDNCCLYYRIPGGGTCGDCVLTPEVVRREQWQRLLSR
ncbi:(2Fe-2S)-binding protein [Paractinoplanes hotanensis]|uniref:(2Fe-2S)-binding protein n=1 Tax=Paractinoplanes hotanensis TaxID=2906497 RepID=A0ABT0XQP9_9ACTN|nr:(2Fe-2S)-binding protein [Actinoplanes hotanensis]MCM4076105.1 (2Fe-2S)-binding protein [Actinoplanes hotanensis]